MKYWRGSILNAGYVECKNNLMQYKIIPTTNVNPVGYKWAYELKLDVKGEIQLYKGRLAWSQKGLR